MARQKGKGSAQSGRKGGFHFCGLRSAGSLRRVTPHRTKRRMTALETALTVLDYAAVAVFGASGALAAARA